MSSYFDAGSLALTSVVPAVVKPTFAAASTVACVRARPVPASGTSQYCAQQPATLLLIHLYGPTASVAGRRGNAAYVLVATACAVPVASTGTSGIAMPHPAASLSMSKAENVPTMAKSLLHAVCTAAA